MTNKTVIISLFVALLFAVGLFVFSVGRIIYGIAHYYLRERKPIRKIQHPQLGLLTSDDADDSLWSGQASSNGRGIRFLLGGNATGPDEQLVAQLHRIIGRFGELEDQAIQFLRSQEPEIGDVKLDLYMLALSDEGHPDDFAFEFVDNTDDSVVWRVEFVGGEPKHTGFDD